MKIVIVLLVAIVCAVIGGWIGGSMVDEMPEPAVRVEGARDINRELMEAQRQFSAGAEIARQRQNNGMIGGAIGLVVGVGLGAFAVSRMGKRA